LLVDRCQACGAGISTRTVIQARCRRCLADITKAKTISIADDEAGLRAQRIIQSWFMENATPGEFSLPEQSPAVLYRIVDGLQRCMRILGDWDWPYLHHPGTKYHSIISEYRNNGQRLSVYESYRLYTTAFRGLMDWPKGFYDFLNNYRQKYVQHSPSVRPQETGNAGELVPGSIQDNLGALYILWIRRYWTSPAYDFLQEAFKRYIAENYLLESSSERTSFHRQVPELAGRLERVSISEACHILKTTPRTMELLVKSGQLTDRSLEGSTDLLLDRREVLSLRSIWIDPLPLKQVAVLLGVTQELVGDLVETGLLSSGQMPPHYLAAEQVTRTSVIGCLERVTKYTKDRFPQNLTDENIWLNALEAARLLVLNGIDAVTLFLWIVGGNLWACLPAGSCFQLESLLFARIDVQACLESIDVNDNLISRETAAMHLGIREVVLARWVRSGLIAPRAVRNHIHYFDRTSLDNFMMSYVADDKITIIDLDPTTDINGPNSG